MDVLDISFSHIKINSPIQHENDLYEFPLDYDDKPFLFSSKQKYGLHQGDSIYQLHIQDKNELMGDDRHEHRVHTIPEVLDEQGCAVLDGICQFLNEVRVAETHRHEATRCLHDLHPAHTLQLRVNEQGVTGRLRHQNSVFCTHGICR